jgi:hypothetical protein
LKARGSALGVYPCEERIVSEPEKIRQGLEDAGLARPERPANVLAIVHKLRGEKKKCIAG